MEGVKPESLGGSGCGCAARGEEPTGQGRGLWVGIGIALSSLPLAALADAVTPLLWPLAGIAAAFGAYRAVAAAGCGFARQGEGTACGLGAAARRARTRRGAALLVLALATAALAACDVPALWPLAGLAGWFGASFAVAAATGYAGCPELGAIPSLILRRELPTTCPPLRREVGS